MLLSQNSIHGLNSRLEGTEERISEFTDKMLDVTTSPTKQKIV